MKNERLEKLKDLLRSPVGVGILVIIVVLIILVVVSVKNALGPSGGESQYEWDVTYEYDLASGTEIAHMPQTNGVSDEQIEYAGMNAIIDGGVTAEQFNVLKEVVKTYAKEEGIDLWRISYLKDSFSVKHPCKYTFKLVLNKDQETLEVKMDSSENYKSLVGLKINLYDEDGKEVYSYAIDEAEYCVKYVKSSKGVNCMNDGT